jgi:Mn2+/Fe2+ NRAMP family transporter
MKTLTFTGALLTSLLVATALLALILLVANNRRVMGEHTNRWLSNIMGVITLVALTVAGTVAALGLWPH